MSNERDKTTTPDGWMPIEQAPKGQVIRAKIWHGDRYWEVDARWAPGPRFWAAVDPHSCVGWKEGVSRPAFYREAESNAR